VLSSIGIALATVLNVLFPGTSFTLMMAISMFGAMFYLADDLCHSWFSGQGAAFLGSRSIFSKDM